METRLPFSRKTQRITGARGLKNVFMIFIHFENFFYYFAILHPLVSTHRRASANEAVDPSISRVKMFAKKPWNFTRCRKPSKLFL